MKNVRKKKIVFISHESTLTGAPVLLLNLLELIKRTGLYDIRIILLRGGILENKFLAFGAVNVLKSKNYGRNSFLLFRGLDYLIFRMRLLKAKNQNRDADIIFNNTITNGKFLKFITGRSTKIVSYVHELESVIHHFAKEADLTIQYSDLLICPSNIVANNLISNHKVSKDKLVFLNYYFPFSKVNSDQNSKDLARKIFEEKIQFSKDKFYVVGMGACTHRKGIDIFVDAARIASMKNKDVHFVWIGGFQDDEMKQKIENEIALHDLNETVTITGQLPHSINNLLPFDIFILSSREDPYPLVVLEAALVKMPSVCFANTGGAEEFIGNDCGWIIDEISSQKLSEKIIEIKAQKEEIERRAENAYEKCVRLHTDVALIQKQFEDIIEKAEKI